ncbi:hypothetical protein [Campylobacter concisus]|uniref:hypothetical protein n=1 Tax=Campylobacter concisus TaxID=199 RepID=UPI0021563EE8|nr:hypothetical protein [Campylobacter concisus]
MKRCAWAEKSEFSRSYQGCERSRAVKEDRAIKNRLKIYSLPKKCQGFFGTLC